MSEVIEVRGQQGLNDGNQAGSFPFTSGKVDVEDLVWQSAGINVNWRITSQLHTPSANGRKWKVDTVVRGQTRGRVDDECPARAGRQVVETDRTVRELISERSSITGIEVGFLQQQVVAVMRQNGQVVGDREEPGANMVLG